MVFSEDRLFGGIGMYDDIAKNTTVSLIQSLNSDNFKITNRLLLSLVSSLVGFVVYHLLVSNVIIPNTGNKKLDRGLVDGFKMITMLFVSQTILSGLNGSVSYSDQWIQSTLLSGISLTVFHTLLADFIPKVDGNNELLLDLGKVIFSSSVVHGVLGGNLMDTQFLESLLITLSGFVVYHKLIRDRLFNLQLKLK